MRAVEKGIFISLAAYASYAFAAFLIKTIPLSFPLIVFARNFIGFCFFLFLFLRKKEELKTKRLPFHFVRSSLSLLSIYFSTYGIQHLNLGNAILLEQTAPFFILAILYIWRGEKISSRTLIAIFAAFIGIGCILSPHIGVWNICAMASLAAALMIGLSYIFIESLTKTESSLSILFYFLSISSLLSFGPALSHWGEIDSIHHCITLIGIGFFFALFQWLLTQALTFAGANVVGGYTFFTAVFSTVLGFFFLGEKLSFPQITGSLLIVGAGIYVFRQKRKKLIPIPEEEK